jgi:hypothetical protein
MDVNFFTCPVNLEGGIGDKGGVTGQVESQPFQALWNA